MNTRGGPASSRDRSVCSLSPEGLERARAAGGSRTGGLKGTVGFAPRVLGATEGVCAGGAGPSTLGRAGGSAGGGPEGQPPAPVQPWCVRGTGSEGLGSLRQFLDAVLSSLDVTLFSGICGW